MRSMHRVAVAALLVASLAAPAAAQQNQNATQSDIQRLQDNIYLADRDVTQVRGRDATRATQLQGELDDLRDEVVYLKVKLRKERALPRAEYADVRDRIEDVRTRARGESANAYTPPASSTATNRGTWQAPPPSGTTSGTTASSTTGRTTTLDIPSGTELDVRLQSNLNSGTAQVEDRFEGTTLVDLNVDGRTAIPAGSIMRGVVTAVEPGTRTNRTARMTVSFDQVTVNGRTYPLRGTVTQAIEGEGIRGEAGRAGAGAAVGGLLGAVLGGVKGAVLGAVIGGGGTIAATEGKEVELPQGSVLRVRIDAPLQVQAPAAR
jgi:Ni/Co efflux regulator RcnB